MKWKNILRTLLCLVLVCALLVQVSPIKAEASTLAVGAVLVKAWPVIKAAAVGLGVVGITDWMVDGLVDNLTGSGIVDKDGYIETYHFGDGFFGLAESSLDFIRSAFFDENYVYAVPVASIDIIPNLAVNSLIRKGAAYENYFKAYPCFKATADCMVLQAYSYRHDGTNHSYEIYNLFLSYENFYVYDVIGSYAGSTPVHSGIKENDYYYALDSFRRGASDSTQSQVLSDLEGFVQIPYMKSTAEIRSYLLEFVPPKIIVDTDYDIALGHIASGGQFHEAYPEWAMTSVEVGGGYYAPIGITAVGGNASATYTQEDVITGQLPIIIIDQTGSGGSMDPSEPDTGKDKFYPMDPNYTTLIERLFGGVTDKIDQFTYSIEEIPGLLREFMLDVKTGLERLPGQFKEWFDDIRTKLQQLAAGQITLADLLSGLFQPIRDAVVDALTYLFAPSETFIKTQVESLIAKYPTSNNLFTLGTRLGDFLLNLGQTPPVIYIDLGAAEGSLLLGGTVAFLDLTWYARYKGTVDGILGAFLWLLFAWRVWLKLPGIIGGASGTIGSILSRKEDIYDN